MQIFTKTEKFFIAMIGVIVIVAVYLCVDFYQDAKAYKEIAEDSESLLEKTLERANEYKAHSEEMEKIAEDAMRQAEVLEKIAGQGIINTRDAQTQVEELTELVKYYQEHVGQYIAVIQWYEKICSKDPNLPEK